MKKPLLVFDFFGVIFEEVAHLWLARHMSKAESAEIIKQFSLQLMRESLRQKSVLLFCQKEVA